MNLRSQTLSIGFNLAKQEIKLRYPNYDAVITESSSDYTENDILNDISLLWTTLDLLFTTNPGNLERESAEEISLNLLTRFYYGEPRLSANELKDIFWEIWKRLTGF